MKNWNRRDWLKHLTIAGGSTGAACFAYGSLYEKGAPKLERASIPLPDKYTHLAGTKIALMSDFHFDEYGDAGLVEKAVRMVNRENVDLVVLGGDFVSDQEKYLEPLGELLKPLQAKAGIFAILGNHDHWMGSHHAVRFLNQAGIRLLKNDTEDLGDFSIVGLESAWGGRPDYSRVSPSIAGEKPVILGWHEPDTFDHYDDDRVILQLSGHTHGGQVCAPIFGPLLLPHLGRKYPSGLYRKANRASHLYVTRGLGVISVPARFLCPPEVSILELGKATSSS